MVQFRNKVIHQGYIPSHSEAQEYIDAVYKYIGQVWKTLQSHCGAFGNHSAKVFPKHAGVPKMSIATVAIAFSVPNDSWIGAINLGLESKEAGARQDHRLDAIGVPPSRMNRHRST